MFVNDQYRAVGTIPLPDRSRVDCSNLTFGGCIFIFTRNQVDTQMRFMLAKFTDFLRKVRENAHSKMHLTKYCF